MAEANPKNGSPENEEGEEQKQSSEEPSPESSPKKSPQSTTEWLMSLMKQSLTLEEKPEQLLPEVSFDGIVEYIKSAKCKNIVTMAGAGISTSAGIPDFRSPGSGLYSNLEKYNLPSPQAIFEIGFFREHPEPFFHLARELWPGLFKPTPGHYFLKLLDNHGLLKRHYTQNIDTLERVAGLDGEKLVEAHGTFHTGHCIVCHAEYTQDWLKEKIFSDDDGVPKCEKEECEGTVKPDIVFFGEALPPRFFNCVSEDLPNCDLLIIMGTSLVVQPFASLTQRVQDTCPRLYINLEKTQESGDPLMALLGMSSGFRFDSEDNYRDIFWQGTCDDGCMTLADKLGWGDELRGMVAKEHERITTEFETEQKAKEGSPGAKESPKSEL